MSNGVTTQDLAYFGTYWQFIEERSDQAPITLGGGYQNATVIRSSDGEFFAGTVEKADASGHVTDVVLSFAGANSVFPDFVSGQLQAYVGGLLGNAEGDQAAAMYEALLNDPRYADAKIHVTGHSLGAGYTQYIAGYALATHGAEATDARAEFVPFAAPGWGPSIAAHFGLSMADFDGHITTYLIQNDQVNSPSPIAAQVGTVNYLAGYHPYHNPALVALDGYAAHWPTAYVEAIGLPSWLSATDQAAATATVRAAANVLFPDDPSYGPAGGVSMTIVGDTAANDLHGGSAADWLIGGGGQDRLTGGAGADVFVFNAASDSKPSAPDVITDFSRAEGDKIDLRGINDDYGLGLIGHLNFIGSQGFTALNQVRVWNDGHDTWVQGDFGRTLAPSFTIKLEGVHSLTAADFILKNSLGEATYTAGFSLF